MIISDAGLLSIDSPKELKGKIAAIRETSVKLDEEQLIKAQDPYFEVMKMAMRDYINKAILCAIVRKELSLTLSCPDLWSTLIARYYMYCCDSAYLEFLERYELCNGSSGGSSFNEVVAEYLDELCKEGLLVKAGVDSCRYGWDNMPLYPTSLCVKFA